MSKAHRVLRPLLQNNNASASVEFALVLPFFIMLLFGIVAYASVYMILNGVQQLASEAARASVSGMSDSERSTLALTYINANAGAYPFLNPAKMQPCTNPSAVCPVQCTTSATTYRVCIIYDMTGSLIYNFIRILPLPAPQVVRSAAIQRGGY